MAVNIFNYVMGATLVALPDFLLGSFGMIPWVVTCSYIGSAVKGLTDISMHGISDSHRALTYVAYSVGAVATFLVIYLIGVYTRRAFQEAIDRSEQNSTVSHGHQ
jgi:uncharacterized membrane protein YdjX (TVP38/TMEM64 family)